MINFNKSSEKYEKVIEPIKIPIIENGIISFNVLRSNSFLNLYTAIKSEKISIGKIIAKAWPNGITTVIRGMEINAIDPPNPDLAIPKIIIAGTTQKKNRRLSSIFKS